MISKSFILSKYYQLPINFQRFLTMNRWKANQKANKETVESHIQTFSNYSNMDRSTMEIDQMDKFRKLLIYSLEHVPYYKKMCKNINPDSIKSYEDVSCLPLIDKKIVAANIRDFISDEYRMEDLAIHSTGGSTGVPLDIYNTKEETKKGRQTLFLWDYMGEIYGKNYKGVYIGTAYKDLTGDPRLWGDHGELYRGSFGINDDRLYMTSMNMTPDILAKYTRMLLSYKPDYIKGYASGVVNLAKYMKNKGISFNAKAILTSSDYLSNKDRQICEKVFGCQVFVHYGQSEDVAAASECVKKHQMHLDMLNCFVEILDSNNQQVFDKLGEIVGTNLNNYVMPLIRYKTGDFAALSKKECGCGDHSWLLTDLVGRIGDKIKCSDGKEVNQVDLVESIANISTNERKVFDALLAYQLIQDRADHIVLVLQTISGLRLNSDEEIIMKNVMFNLINDPLMTYDISYKSVIAEKNGKIRKIICNI